MRKRPVGLVPSGVCKRKSTGPMSASALISNSSVTSLRGGSGPTSTVEMPPFEPSRTSGPSGSSLMRKMRAWMPGSLKKTALALARLSPSTVSSVVAPRGTPRGETELMVGGVVRLPVGESGVVAARAAEASAIVKRDFIDASTTATLMVACSQYWLPHLVNLIGAVKTAYCEGLSVGCVSERKGPVRLMPGFCQGQIVRFEHLYFFVGG